MSEEPSRTVEDALAERLARLGWYASVSALVVLSAIVLGNVLVRLFTVAVNLLLLLVINQGPIVATILGGISTASTYYGWSRIVRRREHLNAREEAKGQAMDQAGNVLQRLAGFGCSSRLSLGVLGAGLLCCLFTYVPSPLHLFGINGPALLQSPTTTTSTTIGTTSATPTPAPQPTSAPRPQPTNIPHLQPTSTPQPAPTVTPVPGKLSLQSPATVKLGNYCGNSFSAASFAFENTGEAPLYWTVAVPGPFQLQSSSFGVLNPGSTQTETFMGTKANGAINIAWGAAATSQNEHTTVTVSCNVLPGNLYVKTPTVNLTTNLGAFCGTNFTGAVFSFTNNGGTTIYWAVQMPRGYSLEAGYPVTGTSQPFQGDTQNEYFQGIANYSTITITWGLSPGNEPYRGTVAITCQNIT